MIRGCLFREEAAIGALPERAVEEEDPRRVSRERLLERLVIHVSIPFPAPRGER